MCYLNCSKTHYRFAHLHGSTVFSGSRGALLEHVCTCSLSICVFCNYSNTSQRCGSKSLTLSAQGTRRKARTAARRISMGWLRRAAHELRAGASAAAASPAFPMAFSTSCIWKCRARQNRKLSKCWQLYNEFHGTSIFCAKICLKWLLVIWGVYCSPYCTTYTLALLGGQDKYGPCGTCK